LSSEVANMTKEMKSKRRQRIIELEKRYFQHEEEIRRFLAVAEELKTIRWLSDEEYLKWLEKKHELNLKSKVTKRKENQSEKELNNNEK